MLPPRYASTLLSTYRRMYIFPDPPRDRVHKVMAAVTGESLALVHPLCALCRDLALDFA